MKTMSAVEAKTHFGKLLDFAQREPVIITKKNRAVGVMFSMQDVEDTVWGQRAQKAAAEGYLSADESDSVLKDLLDAGASS